MSRRWSRCGECTGLIKHTTASNRNKCPQSNIGSSWQEMALTQDLSSWNKGRPVTPSAGVLLSSPSLVAGRVRGRGKGEIINSVTDLQ